MPKKGRRKTAAAAPPPPTDVDMRSAEEEEADASAAAPSAAGASSAAAPPAAAGGGGGGGREGEDALALPADSVPSPDAASEEDSPTPPDSPIARMANSGHRDEHSDDDDEEMAAALADGSTLPAAAAQAAQAASSAGAAAQAAQASNPYLSSRAPRAAVAASPSPSSQQSPSPSPSPTREIDEAQSQRAARELARVEAWHYRLRLDGRSSEVEVDRAEAVTDRSTFHSMVDTYFRPVDYMDLLKIGQLKVLLTPMQGSSSQAGSTSSAAATNSASTTKAEPASFVDPASTPPARSSSSISPPAPMGLSVGSSAPPSLSASHSLSTAPAASHTGSSSSTNLPASCSCRECQLRNPSRGSPQRPASSSNSATVGVPSQPTSMASSQGYPQPPPSAYAPPASAPPYGPPTSSGPVSSGSAPYGSRPQLSPAVGPVPSASSHPGPSVPPHSHRPHVHSGAGSSSFPPSSAGLPSAARSSPNPYPTPPRVHSSQFVSVLQALRSVSNSLSHLSPSCLPPSYMTPPAYWDPSMVLPPLGVKQNPAQLAICMPPSATDPVPASMPPNPEIHAPSHMQEVTAPLPHLPQFSEFPHLSLMLGLTVHPDSVCIPHTQALLTSNTSTNTNSTTSIPGTASWSPKPVVKLEKASNPAAVGPSAPVSLVGPSSSSQLTLAAHPYLSPTKDLGVPVLFTLYESAAGSSATAPSTSSKAGTDGSKLAGASQSSSSAPVSVLVDYLASGLSASVAPLASSMSAALSHQLQQVQPRLSMMNFIPVHNRNERDARGIGYAVEDRQVDKYWREFREREAAATAAAGSAGEESRAAAEKEKPNEGNNATDTSSKSGKPSSSSVSSAKSNASMPALEGGSSHGNVETVLPDSPLLPLVQYVQLEACHTAAQHANLIAIEEREAAGEAAKKAVRVKVEAEAVTDTNSDMEVDSEQQDNISLAANLPHSLIPESALVKLPPLPKLPAALSADSVLHELLQLQFYLYLQSTTNHTRASSLRSRIHLQHQSLYIEKRVQWMRTIHETYHCARLWQTLRLQLKKGVRDAPLPPALQRQNWLKREESNREPDRPRDGGGSMRIQIKSEPIPAGKHSKLLTAQPVSTVLTSALTIDEAKSISSSLRGGGVLEEWAHKTEAELEAELQAGESAEEDYSVCAVCFDGESMEENPILFCERCNVSVHARCYGLQSLPDVEGWQWMCSWCTAWKERIRQKKLKEKERERAKAKAAQLAAVILPGGTPSSLFLSSSSTPATPTSTGSAASAVAAGDASTKPQTNRVRTDTPTQVSSSPSPSPSPSSVGSSPDPGAFHQITYQPKMNGSASSGNASTAAGGSAASGSSLSAAPPPNPYICALCPSSGGAVKPTADLFDAEGSPAWVHIVCALWIPKARIMNTRNMEPISVATALKLQQQQYHRQCSICKLNYGACVPCSHDDCSAYFHPLCAWYEGLAMMVDVVEIDCRFLLYCLKHTPKYLVDRLLLHSPEDVQAAQVVTLSHLDRCVIRARQQREIRQRGRAHHSEKTREKRRKRQLLERKRKERARAMREDLYEIGRCAVCFQTSEECALSRAMEEVRKREIALTKPNATGTMNVSFLVNGIAPAASTKNRLLRCEECEIEVHQNCYGVTDAEYDDLQKRIQTETHNQNMNAPSATAAAAVSHDSGWLCRRCQQSTNVEKDVSCALCPRKGGAFKKTMTGRWAHVVCALFTPETSFADPVRLEPIEGVADIPKPRKRQPCYLCHRPGVCAQCSHPDCQNFVHPTCGLFSGAYMTVLELQPPPPPPHPPAQASAPEAPQPNGSSGATAISAAAHSGSPAAPPASLPAPIPVYRVYCKKHSPLHLSKFLPLPPAYTKMLKLHYALESSRAGIDRLRAMDKKKTGELKESLDKELMVWRESKKEAETGIKSKLLKAPKQARGKKLQQATAAQQAIAPTHASGTTSAEAPGHASEQTPKGKGKKATSVAAAAAATNGEAAMDIDSPHAAITSPHRAAMRNRKQTQLAAATAAAASGAAMQSNPGTLLFNAGLGQMIPGGPFTGASGPLPGMAGADSNSLLSSALAPLLSSNAMNSNLNGPLFPFGPMPSSNMPLLPMSLAAAGSTSLGSSHSMMPSGAPNDINALLDVPPRKPARGRKPQTKELSDTAPLMQWLQALDSSAAANNLVHSLGANAPFNPTNPFAPFSSINQMNPLTAAFYAQLAAANLPAALMAASGGGNSALHAQLLSSLLAAGAGGQGSSPFGHPMLPLPVPQAVPPPSSAVVTPHQQPAVGLINAGSKRKAEDDMNDQAANKKLKHESADSELLLAGKGRSNPPDFDLPLSVPAPVGSSPGLASPVVDGDDMALDAAGANRRGRKRISKVGTDGDATGSTLQSPAIVPFTSPAMKGIAKAAANPTAGKRRADD